MAEIARLEFARWRPCATAAREPGLGAVRVDRAVPSGALPRENIPSEAATVDGWQRLRAPVT
jgi:hypothetical protein